MRKLLRGALIGAIVAMGLSIIIVLPLVAAFFEHNGGGISMIEPWRPEVWLREDWRDWRNFYALGIAAGALVGMLWTVFPRPGPTSYLPAPGKSLKRAWGKVSLGIIMLLAILGASLAITPVCYAMLACCRGDNLYYGLPASYWVDQLKMACQPVKVQADAQGLVAIFGGFAVEGLMKILADDVKKEAVPALVEMLHDPNPTARTVAAKALQRIGPEAAEAAPALIDMSKNDQQARVRLNAAISLVAIGTGAQNAVPTLVDGLKDEMSTWDESSQAANALGQLGTQAKDAVPTLIELIRNNNRQSALALEALKKIDPKSAAIVATKKKEDS